MSAQPGIYNVAAALRDSLRNTIDMDNVVTHTIRPVIRTKEESDGSDETTNGGVDGKGTKASGRIILDYEEQGDSPFITYDYEHEIFIIEGSYNLDGNNLAAITEDYMNELKRVVRALNQPNNRSYEYRLKITPIRFVNNPLFHLEFTLIREFVKKYG